MANRPTQAPQAATQTATVSARSFPNDDAFLRFALDRLGTGATEAELRQVAASGFGPWLDTQLAVKPDAADPEVERRLAATTLKIKYPAGEGYEAKEEARPLTALDKPVEALWPVAIKEVKADGAERRRPRDEVIAATLVRGVYSRWPVRETLVSFWHDHFNVDSGSAEQIMAAWPDYDRVIRRHALGNFRQFLEAVARSTAMLIYLSNRSSRAGAANENWARELFELHTLGRDAYFNDQYNRWRDVPGAAQGRPIGYIDQDVYESARAFTGWTIEDGQGLDSVRKLPRTGKFVYVDSFHDGYQKRVLASEFDPFAAPQADGRKVLDLVAAHPATAKLVAGKLCRRLIGEQASPAAREAAARVFLGARAAPDQIAQTVRAIVSLPEFAASRGAKARRPLAIAVAFARQALTDFTPTEALWNQLAAAGQRVFGWGPPTGLPDENGYFLSTNGMRQRWALVWGLAHNQWQNGALDVAGLPPGIEAGAAAQHWLQRVSGRAEPEQVAAILGGMGLSGGDRLGGPQGPDMGKLASMAAYAASTPQFQMS